MIAIATTIRTPYTPLLVTDRVSRQKVRKDSEDLRAKISLCNG